MHTDEKLSSKHTLDSRKKKHTLEILRVYYKPTCNLDEL
jgi:hypothetical protein